MDYLLLLRGANCSGIGVLVLVTTALKVHGGQIVLSI